MGKNENPRWEGFKGAAIFLVLAIFLNLVLGSATTNGDVNGICLKKIGLSVGSTGFEIIRTPHSDFCYQVAQSTITSYTYLNPPKYIGKINCKAKTFFWESKECFLQEKT